MGVPATLVRGQSSRPRCPAKGRCKIALKRKQAASTNVLCDDSPRSTSPSTGKYYRLRNGDATALDGSPFCMRIRPGATFFSLPAAEASFSFSCFRLKSLIMFCVAGDERERPHETGPSSVDAQRRPSASFLFDRRPAGDRPYGRTRYPSRTPRPISRLELSIYVQRVTVSTCDAHMIMTIHNPALTTHGVLTHTHSLTHHSRSHAHLSPLASRAPSRTLTLTHSSLTHSRTAHETPRDSRTTHSTRHRHEDAHATRTTRARWRWLVGGEWRGGGAGH